MLDVCLLGTSGMLPLPDRWLTSLMTRYNGSSLLIDCGEGTQIAIKEKGWSFNPIDVICFTHYHADHISGLPGLLLTIGNSDRTKPVTLVGPKGLSRVVGALRVIAPELPFELKFIELTKPQEHISINGYEIEAFKVSHTVACYGYSTVEIDGTVYTPDMVMGKPRKGLKVTYCTDTRPVTAIIENAKHSDLFICEGMYGEEDKDSKAKENKHMTFSEAAALAKDAEVAEMWLTHFSPSLVRPQEYIRGIQKIFENVTAGTDGKTVELQFEEG